MKNKRIRVDIKVGWFLLFLIVVIQPLIIFGTKYTKPKKNYNYQTALTFANDTITNHKTYFKDGKLISEFFILTKTETNDYEWMTHGEYYRSNLKSPISIKTYLLDKVSVDNAGTLTTELPNNPINTTSVKNGEVELFDNVEEVKKYKYLLLSLSDSDDVSKDKQKQNYVIINTANILDFVDVSDFFNDTFKLKSDKKAYKKYQEWIYKNEVNETLFTTFNVLDSQGKSYAFDRKNIIKDIQNLRVNDVKIRLYFAKNVSIWGDSWGEWNTIYYNRRIPNLSEIQLDKSAITTVDSYLEQRIEQYNLEYSNSINNEKIQEKYDQIKDIIGGLDRINYLKSLGVEVHIDGAHVH